ncbi:MAG TPA: hypothetical protein VKU83_10315, partial [Puia sp.]|nr:hypothetical protein [Puia sp.]
PLPFFPTDKTEIDYASAQRDRAAIVASLGWPRGDLWADYALSADCRFLNDVPASTTIDRTEPVSEHALALAPYDARLWLLLSAINAQSGWKDDKTLAQLKMSYYTAPNDIRLIPLRISIALQSQAIGDKELQELVEHEIRTIIMRKPELKPVIATAYRGASAAGRAFVEEKLAVLDRKFLTDLQTISTR